MKLLEYPEFEQVLCRVADDFRSHGIQPATQLQSLLGGLLSRKVKRGGVYE